MLTFPAPISGVRMSADIHIAGCRWYGLTVEQEARRGFGLVAKKAKDENGVDLAQAGQGR